MLSFPAHAPLPETSADLADCGGDEECFYCSCPQTD